MNSLTNFEAGGDTEQELRGWPEGESFPPSTEITYVKSGSQFRCYIIILIDHCLQSTDNGNLGMRLTLY